MPQADRSLGRLTAEGESLDQELVRILAIAGAFPQLLGPLAKAGVVEGLQLGFDLVDGRRHREVAFDLPLVRVQQLGQVQHRTRSRVPGPVHWETGLPSVRAPCGRADTSPQGGEARGSRAR